MPWSHPQLVPAIRRGRNDGTSLGYDAFPRAEELKLTALDVLHSGAALFVNVTLGFRLPDNLSRHLGVLCESGMELVQTLRGIPRVVALCERGPSLPTSPKGCGPEDRADALDKLLQASYG